MVDLFHLQNQLPCGGFAAIIMFIFDLFLPQQPAAREREANMIYYYSDRCSGA
jgi:hypothetical protein